MRPHAIVIGLGVNGLNMARSLAARGVVVHGVSLRPDEIGRSSRAVRLVDAHDLLDGETPLERWLEDLAGSIGNLPAVFPTSDAHALALARARPRLERVARLWSTDPDVLVSLVRKDELRGVCERAGVATPPSLVAPTRADVAAWVGDNPGPYLAKPWYEQAKSNPLGAKNRVFRDAAELVAFVARHGGEALVVQRMLRGGDDWHYSVAGLCDRDGRIVTMATKRKIVQYPPDTGITAHGVVPACPPAEEARYFEATRALLAAVRFEGLFGLEFLKERATGDIYLLDFNPRSLYTTSHYVACGLDFPYLAYRLLCGDELAGQPQTPRLPRTYWGDAWACGGAWRRLRGTGRLGFLRLLGILLRSRAQAVWSWRDPLPGLRHAWRCVRGALVRRRAAPEATQPTQAPVEAERESARL